jgi:hypothetical protein
MAETMIKAGFNFSASTRGQLFFQQLPFVQISVGAANPHSIKAVAVSTNQTDQTEKCETEK